jgi:hypothetical protein
MKIKLKKIQIISMLVTILCISPFFALAQDPGDDPDAPIDGGLSLLIAAGAAYGVKKYRNARKQKNMAGNETEIEK